MIEPDQIHAALEVALEFTQAGALWLHLVTLCQRAGAKLHPRWAGPHVYLADLRLTRCSEGWRAYRERRPGSFHRIETDTFSILSTTVTIGGAP